MGNKYYWFSLMLATVLFLGGCGGKGGAPGSSGSSETGILIQSVRIEANGTECDLGPDLDVNLHICPDGLLEPGLFRVDATMLIGATALNPDVAFDPFPASLEECTITYKKSDDDPSAPIIDSWRIFPNCTLTDQEENECGVNLLGIQRKTDFWGDIVSGINIPRNMPTRYIAVFNCSYKNIFAETGRLQVEYEIFLADFECCA
jgi:hypothetical protein